MVIMLAQSSRQVQFLAIQGSLTTTPGLATIIHASAFLHSWRNINMSAYLGYSMFTWPPALDMALMASLI